MNDTNDTTAALRAAPAGDANNAHGGDDTMRPSPKSVATNATNFDDHKNTLAPNDGEDAEDANANNDEPELEQDTVTASLASEDTATPTPTSDDDSVDGVNSTQMQIVPKSSVQGKDSQQQMIVASQPKPHQSQQSIFAKFTLNRQTITSAGLAVAGGIVTTLTGTICFIGLAAFASSPLWLPLLLITSPFWLPFAFFTSPLWVSAVAIGAICVLWAAFFAVLAFGTFLFFSWPAKWLPDPKDSDRSKWFLCQRDRATLALVKLQAKIVLYAAGVGPLADAAFAITDRIDLVELQRALSDFDLAQFAEDVKKMDIGEIQAAIIGAIRSFIGL